MILNRGMVRSEQGNLDLGLLKKREAETGRLDGGLRIGGGLEAGCLHRWEDGWKYWFRHFAQRHMSDLSGVFWEPEKITE